MSKNIKANRGPGRPAYSPKFPKSLKWTMADWCEANGINPKTGKGPNCSKLTLIKYKNNHPKDFVRVKNEFREPASKDGLGRKCFLFSLSARAKSAKATKAAKVSKKVTVNVGTDYDAVKAALLAPTPTVDIPAPVEVTPEVVPAVAETVTAPEATPALVS